MTKDGSQLIGEIILIDEGRVTLKTAYAGEITVQQSHIETFTTTQPVALRLKSGNVMSGVAKKTADGGISIENEDGHMQTRVSKVTSAWKQDTQDPQRTRMLAEKEALKRKWKYTAAFNAGGKKGNSDSFDLALKLGAQFKSPEDLLNFYLRTTQGRSEGQKTDNETVGGVRYDAFFRKYLGWYARQEVEHDEFEGLDLRSTSAAGLSARIWDEDDSKLKTSAGLAYRYSSFDNGTNEQAPSLDFGLSHWYQHNELFTVDTELSFVPSVEDFSEYTFYHDTGVNVPVSRSKKWNLRFGLSNAYNSEPPTGKTELDTTYYSGLLLNWE